MAEFNNNFLGSKTSGAFGTGSNPVTNYARIGYSQKLYQVSSLDSLFKQNIFEKKI